MTDKVEIYTDGACKGNPGPGGWGALLVYKGKELELWGGEADTTNNRMELTAAIRGLAELKKPCAVHLVTDSKYVMQGIQEWLENWKKRGWKTAAKTRGLKWQPWGAGWKHGGQTFWLFPVTRPTTTCQT